MRKVVFLIFGWLIICNITAAQECDSELCQQIFKLMKINREKDDQIRELLSKVEDLVHQYETLQKKNSTDKARLKVLGDQINQLTEQRLKAEDEKLKKLEELARLMDRLKEQESRTDAQEHIIREYEEEVAKLKKMNTVNDEKNRTISRAMEKMCRENSYISWVELGYEKAGNVYYHKVVKGSKEFFEDDRLFWRNKLNVLRMNGKLYVRDGISPSEQMLKGKLLVYGNNQLITAVDFNLVKTGKIDSYNRFEIITDTIKLNNAIPENSEVKVAFVDDVTYYNSDLDVFRSFWVAEFMRLFKITSLKPSRLEAVVDVDQILKASLVKEDTIKTRKEVLPIRLFDNGDIDNDRASFYLNGEKVIDNLGLSAEGYHQTLQLHKGINRFTIYALSSGSVGDCKALLQAYEGDRCIKSDVFLKAQPGKFAETVIIQVLE